jgi:hypothetical protein
MKQNELRRDASPRRVERRRRWKKREDFNQTFRMSLVGFGNDPTVNPGAYRRGKVYSCTLQDNQ